MIRSVRAAWSVGLLIGLIGCQTLRHNVIACPLSAKEEVAEIRRVVPLGTQRSVAAEALRNVGIQGNFGLNETIFYCDLWNRRDGERWLMNVALLFDDSGRLYATRPDAEGQIPVSPREESPGTRSETAN